MGKRYKEREHPVPCKKCGFRMNENTGKPEAVSMTWNYSALCDDCDVQERTDAANAILKSNNSWVSHYAQSYEGRHY